MIKINNSAYFFKKSLFCFLKKDTGLNKIDFLIMQELYNIIKDTMDYATPFFKKKERLDLNNKRQAPLFYNKAISFEFELTEIPDYKFLLFKIPNNNNLSLLSSYLSSPIVGDLVFMVVKKKSNWFMSFSALETKSGVAGDILLLKSSNSKALKNQSDSSILKSVNFNKSVFLNMTRDFEYFYQKNEANIFCNEKGVIIHKKFIFCECDFDKIDQDARFYLHALYNINIG